MRTHSDPPATGLFFGSFNPIHNGHVAIARYMLDAGHCEEVWFVVSPRNPLKEERDLLPEQARLEIVKAAIDADPRMRACDIEFSMPRPSYTYLSLERLSSLHPDRPFLLIIGGDNFLHFNEWREYRAILLRYPLLVYPRPGVLLPPPPSPSVTLTDAPLLPLSSTDIREKIARGEEISRLVPPTALPLIKRHYGARGKG
ncbi:MAG: nicotinate-nucleotide adenylyltransferase [Odoribacteraceae bacterium]|jgi:nicotinate-nucleotide adenylyltransferase|nr:nicotinate-nucleotide adenylyltransferase [Odoribacteraceae bacterium]